MFGPLKNLKISKFSKVTQHDLLYHKVFFVESIITIKIRMFHDFGDFQKLSELSNFSAVFEFFLFILFYFSKLGIHFNAI